MPASACLRVFAMMLDGLYTLRSRCASSMTTRSQARVGCRRLCSGKMVGADDDLSVPSNGWKLPCFTAALYDFASRMRQGQEELLRQLLIPLLAEIGRMMTRIRRLRSAHFCERTRPASMVLPRPTSSARMAPFESGERKAKGRRRPGGGSGRPVHPAARRRASRRCRTRTASSARGRNTSRGTE